MTEPLSNPSNPGRVAERRAGARFICRRAAKGD